ncbi:ankyrin repeat-containing domain protein [Geopyxis carbonaria]|nr:ankyrin repeat-containing domain protein [Geopyxis carbonaria]
MTSKTTSVGLGGFLVCEQTLMGHSANNTSNNLVVRPHRRHTESAPKTHTKVENQEILKRSHSLTVSSPRQHVHQQHQHQVHGHHHHLHLYTHTHKSPVPISTVSPRISNAGPNNASSSIGSSVNSPKRPPPRSADQPSHVATTIPLLNFPSEIIFSISDHLPAETVARLSSTCRDLHHLLTPSVTTLASNTIFPDGGTVLHWAAARGYAALILRLLRRGNVDPAASDHEGVTPIMQALLHTTSSARFSVADPSSWTRSTLACVRHLLDAGVRVGVDDLAVAVKSGNTTAVQWLLDLPGLSIGVRDRNGEGVMHWVSECWAVSSPSASPGESAAARMGRFLIAHGADVDMCCDRGMSPMVKARGMANAGVVGLLVELKGLKARVPQKMRTQKWG